MSAEQETVTLSLDIALSRARHEVSEIPTGQFVGQLTAPEAATFGIQNMDLYLGTTMPAVVTLSSLGEVEIPLQCFSFEGDRDIRAVDSDLATFLFPIVRERMAAKRPLAPDWEDIQGTHREYGLGVYLWGREYKLSTIPTAPLVGTFADLDEQPVYIGEQGWHSYRVLSLGTLVVPDDLLLFDLGDRFQDQPLGQNPPPVPENKCYPLERTFWSLIKERLAAHAPKDEASS